MDFLGNSPRIKLIDFFLENRDESFCMTEIYKRTEVSYPSIKTHIPLMLSHHTIKIHKRVGKIFFFTVNKETLYFKPLLALKKRIDRDG